MARKPRTPKPKLPKAKSPLGQRVKNEVRSSIAKGLTKNFGALGSAVAKRYVAPPKTSRRRIPDPGKANHQNIPKKNIKKDAPVVDSILESAKQVSSTIDIVALNAARSFSLATRQANIMGDEVSSSLRELNNILDRMFYKGPQPPPLPLETSTSTIPNTQNSQSTDDNNSGPSWTDIAKIGAGSFAGRVAGSIVKGAGTGAAIVGGYEALKGIKRDSQTGNHVRTWLRGLLGIEDPGEAAPWAGALSNKEYEDAVRNRDNTPPERQEKVEVGKDSVMFKLTYKADKITFKSENAIKFKTRSPAGSGFTRPQSGGFFNGLADKMTGGPGGAGFFNNLADRIFGTGQQMPGGVNNDGTGSNSKNSTGQGSSDNGVSKPDIDYQGPNTGAYDSTKARANYMQPGSQFGQPGENITTVQTEGGHKFQINSASAEAFKRFIESAEKEGMPLGTIGGYSPRPGGIAGTGRMSQHSMGNAMDIGSQTARDVISPKTREWIESHPKQFRKMLDENGMISGGDWKNPDLGHIEWSGRKPWLEDKDGKPLPKDGVSATQKDDAGASSLKAFDGFVGDGKEEGQSSGFDFERWKWMRPKNPEDIEDRTGEDSAQWETVPARAAARMREIAGTRWMASQPIPDPSTLSMRLGSNNLDFALMATSRKDIRESLGIPDPKRSGSQQFVDEPQGVNTESTKRHQGIDFDDLDHRPRREAVPPEKYDDYMGTSSGMEDSD